MELKTARKASLDFFDFSLDEKGINITSNSVHNTNISAREFAKMLFYKLNYPEPLCEKILR